MQIEDKSKHCNEVTNEVTLKKKKRKRKANIEKR